MKHLTFISLKAYISSKVCQLSLCVLAIISNIGMPYMANAMTPDELIQSQAQRNKQLQDRLVPTPDVMLDTSLVKNKSEINPTDAQTADLPCFPIHQIGFSVLKNSDVATAAKFDFALLPSITGKHSLLGQCLNVTDIQSLAHDVQNRIIEQGYVTTRVMIGDQNLSTGKLFLTLLVGRVQSIKADIQDSRVPVYFSSKDIPVVLHELDDMSGKPLNIRQIETALENLKRVPSASANVDITPSENAKGAGFSDLIISYNQDRRFRGSLSLDDAGSQSTGKYQATGTLSIDNPTSHNDLFYLSYTQDLGGGDNKGDKGAKNYGLGYVLPIKSSLLSLNANHYQYHQTVAGASQDYLYAGTSDSVNVGLSHLLYRDSHSKTHLDLGGFVKSQDSSIDNTPIDVQKRRISGLTLGISHQTHILGAQLKTNIGYQRGINAFNALTPPEELFDEGTNRTGIFKLNVQLQKPFSLKQSQFHYLAQLRGQYAQDALVPSERMSIGGRYTVRGFDGERTLSGDHGILLRQDLSFYPKALNSTKQSHALYLGLDAGRIGMVNKEQADLLLGKSLIGSAIGIKGTLQKSKYHSLNYDAFISHPLKQPKGFSDKDWVGGFSVGVEF